MMCKFMHLNGKWDISSCWAAVMLECELCVRVETGYSVPVAAFAPLKNYIWNVLTTSWSHKKIYSDSFLMEKSTCSLSSQNHFAILLPLKGSADSVIDTFTICTPEHTVTCQSLPAVYILFVCVLNLAINSNLCFNLNINLPHQQNALHFLPF